MFEKNIFYFFSLQRGRAWPQQRVGNFGKSNFKIFLADTETFLPPISVARCLEFFSIFGHLQHGKFVQ